MKKTILLLTILLYLLNPKVHSQNIPISFSVGGAYSTQAGKNSVETFVNTKQDKNQYFTENKKFSLGGGWNLGGNIGYNFHENMGINLGFYYHLPQDVNFHEINAVAGVQIDKDRILSATRFSFIPSFQLNTSFEKLNTFVRIGVSINSMKQKLFEEVTIDTNIWEYFWEYEGKSNIGFYGQWGLDFKFSEHVAIEFSLAYEGFLFSPDENKLVKAMKNKRNQNIDNMPEIEKSVVFEDWVSDQYNQYPDPNKPLILPRQNFSYHNLSVALSLTYHF